MVTTRTTDRPRGPGHVYAPQRTAPEDVRDALHGQVPEAPLQKGGRPAPLSEVAGWQSRVLRHVVGHLSVLALDVPVPQMVDQLPDIEQFFRALSPDPEQVIEVPKILPFDVPMHGCARSAAGGTAGGSADDHLLFLVTADCGAACRHSSS